MAERQARPGTGHRHLSRAMHRCRLGAGTGEHLLSLVHLLRRRLARSRRRSARLLKEAQEKGDLFTQVNLGTFMEPLTRLAENRPDEAREVIQESIRAGRAKSSIFRT